MFYPFRDESELMVGQISSYSSKLSELGVLEIVNNNKRLVESYSDPVNAAFLNFRADITPSWDPFLQQENEDVEKQYLLNSIQPFLVTVRSIVKLNL